MRIVLAIAVAAVTMLGPVRGTAEDVATGQALAERHCSRCHVIGDFNRFGGIGSTPSFQLLVDAFDDWQERFETFQARRPHPSFVRVTGFDYPDPTVFPPNVSPVEIELSDIAAIRAFAETLKKK